MSLPVLTLPIIIISMLTLPDPKPIVIERIIEKIVHVHMADDTPVQAVPRTPARREPPVLSPVIGDVSVFVEYLLYLSNIFYIYDMMITVIVS